MMEKKAKYLLGIILGVIIIITSILALTGNLSFLSSYSDSQVKIAIPHYGSFECKDYPAKIGQSTTFGTDVLLSKDTVGVYTNGIYNIESTVDYGFFTSLIKDVRIKYQICDEDGRNCGSYQYVTYIAPGTRQFSFNSINFNSQSLRVSFEKRTITSLLQWVADSGAKLTYDLTPYKLVYHSTTQDPAGSIVCSSSCDLSCPSLSVRNKLIFTQDNILDFGDTAPSLEYWESLDYDLNVQGGATVYNPDTNKFCLAGAIYTGSTLSMDNGVTYVYPNVNTKQTKTCCPGATISSTYSDKVCTSSYTWKVVQDSDKLTCISDANCPNAGNSVCQNKQLSSGYSCGSKDSNNIGICKLSSSRSVECCSDSDCNTDMSCQLSTHTCVGGTINPTCGDSRIDVTEQCDDGNTRSGDGCSSSCQSEIVCSDDEDCEKGFSCENTRCVRTKCAWYDIPCKLKSLFSGIFSFFNVLKYLVIFIFGAVSIFISSDILKSVESLEENKVIRWIISSIIGIGIGLLLYTFIYGLVFWIIVVLGIGYMLLGQKIKSALGL